MATRTNDQIMVSCHGFWMDDPALLNMYPKLASMHEMHAVLLRKLGMRPSMSVWPDGVVAFSGVEAGKMGPRTSELVDAYRLTKIMGRAMVGATYAFQTKVEMSHET